MSPCWYLFYLKQCNIVRTPSWIITSGIPISSGKISYSLIEPELLPSTPTYGHKVHALAFHPHPTFTAPLVGSAFKIRSEIGGGVFFWGNSQRVQAVGCLRRGALSLIFGNSVFRRFPPLELHKGILNSYLLILLIHTKHKYSKM